MLFWLAAASIVLTSDAGHRQVFELRGVDAARLSNGQMEAGFRVYVDGVAGAPAVMGTYSMLDGIVRFVPRFPLQPGLTYRAEWTGSKPVLFKIARPEIRPTARLEHIYPSAAELPANQLKLYLQFSAPMSRGEAFRRIHLLDDHGVEVSAPFLEIEEELWDGEGKRLTVLFDPGRIKRGLVPHNEAGPALVAGRSYRIVVDRDWLDAAGTPLMESYTKQFRVLPDDRTPPTMSNWRLQIPTAGSREPMQVDLPEPLDAALLRRLVWVERDGRRVEGRSELSNEERRWSFNPTEPWEAGKYLLQAGSIVEDLAGNRLDRKFDVDTFDRVEMRRTVLTKSIPFSVVHLSK